MSKSNTHIPLLPFLGNISNIFPCQPWLDSIMLFVTVIHSRTQCTEVNGILVGCPISWFHFKLTVRLHGWISFDAYKYLRTCNYDTTLHFQANGYICVQIHTPAGLRLRCMYILIRSLSVFSCIGPLIQYARTQHKGVGCLHILSGSN